MASLRIASFLFIAVLIFAGCDELKKDDDNPVSGGTTTVVNYNTLKPVGTISGKVVDRHTEKPVNGAVISVGFNGGVVTTTSDASGSFSFADVPCNRDATTGLTTGTYHLTVSLVEVNKSIPENEPKYREFYFNSTLSVTFIDLNNEDSAKVPVEGLAANIRFDVGKMNTTIKGSVVDERYTAVSGATVYLQETNGDVLQTVQTDGNGGYTFNNVEGGTSVFIEAISADGILEGGLNGILFLPINKNTINLRQQVNAERILITQADNVNPYVTVITPENLSDVNPNGLTIVYKFSEPVKQMPYTTTQAPLGLGTLIDDIHVNFVGLKKSTGNIPFSIAWDTSFTMLTVTPREIVGSARYTVNISAALGKMMDRANNGFVANAVVGDFEDLNITTNGSTTLPAAPAVSRRFSSGLGYASLDFTGGTVGLDWNYDANARSYRIFRSVNGEPYKLLADNVYDTRYDDNTGNLVTSYNPPGDRDPYSAFSVSYKVYGLSKDLVEGPASNVVTVKDETAPQVSSTIIDSSASITGGEYLYIRFTEPLTKSASQSNENYSVVNSGGGEGTSVLESVYMGYDNISARYVVRLTVTKGSIEAGDVLIVQPGVIDLAGNAIDGNKNNHTF
ncbi:MAG: carboxypeptidase-like regulatory domain-containing protein [Bacteroidota bacterium]